jgi:hypothetical protein
VIVSHTSFFPQIYFHMRHILINFFSIIARTVAQRLEDDLRDAATETDNPRRTEHLFQIFRTAARVKQKMSNHADEWSFGPWDDAMLFPKVTASDREMMRPQYR